MAPMTPKDSAPRPVASLRARLWPHQRDALDRMAGAARIEFASPLGRTVGGARAYDVVVEDEAFYSRIVTLPHAPGAAPADPVAAAMKAAGRPELVPEDWDLASSACKAGYGAEVRAVRGGTEVELNAKVIVSRGVAVEVDSGRSPLQAAIDAVRIEWPADNAGWSLSWRRGFEAFDADPIELEDLPSVDVEPEPEGPRLGM
jgi:hypothetical protein